MKNKALILILIALILLGLAFVLVRQKAQAPAPTPESQAATTTAATATPRTYAWRFQTTESAQDYAPRTQVDLITGGSVYNAGAYAGSCVEMEKEKLLDNEVSAVLCWFAGGGDEVGVFKEGSHLVLKVGGQGEPTVDSPATRGGFRNIYTIE